jgi:hypothetical protein
VPDRLCLDALAAERRRITESITQLAVDQIGMPPDDVVLAPPRSLLKTSSGKSRRPTCRELSEQGALGRTPRAPWWQLARFIVRGAAAQARRAAGASSNGLGLPGLLTFDCRSGPDNDDDLTDRASARARAWARAAIAMGIVFALKS